MVPTRHLILRDAKLNPAEEWTHPESEGWCFLHAAEGSGYFWENSRPRELMAGECVVFQPAQPVTFRASQVAGLRLRHFLFLPSLLSGFLTLREIDCLLRPEPDHNRLRHFPKEHPCSKSFAKLAENAHESQPLLARCQALLVAGLVFADEIDAADHEPRRSVSAGRRFAEIMAQIPANEIGLLSVKDLAAMCGCSERHFNRLFRSCFHGSIRSKQIDLRLERAMELLQDTEAVMSQIAVQSGFASMELFSRMFKKRYGLSPSVWRERHQNGNGNGNSSRTVTQS